MKTNCKPFFVHLERNVHHFIHRSRNFHCHCEERSDVAIPIINAPVQNGASRTPAPTFAFRRGGVVPRP